MGILDQLDGIEKMLNLTPFFRCPNCGKRDEGGGSPTFFVLNVMVEFAAEVDDAAKRFEARLTSWEFHNLGEKSKPHELSTDVTLTCNDCQHVFLVPKDWSYRIN